MATLVLTQNGERVTVPANTSEHEIDFDALLQDSQGEALIEWVSGTAVQINSNGVAITSATATLATGNNKFILPVRKGVRMKYKGGAGSEVFQVYITE